MTDTMFDLIGIAAAQIRRLGWSQLPLHIVGGGGGNDGAYTSTSSGPGLPNQALQLANIFGEW